MSSLYGLGEKRRPPQIFVLLSNLLFVHPPIPASSFTCLAVATYVIPSVFFYVITSSFLFSYQYLGKGSKKNFIISWGIQKKVV